METIDYKLLSHLQKDGRASWAELGKLVGLTPPAAAERVRKLEEAGVIRGFTAAIDPALVGAELTSMVFVTIDRPKDRKPFLERVNRVHEIQECHHVAGDHDYLLKIRCRGTADLERVISEEIKSLSGVVRTYTIIVMSTAKETTFVPLESDKPGKKR